MNNLNSGSKVETISERKHNADDDQVLNSFEEELKVEFFTALEIGFTSQAT